MLTNNKIQAYPFVRLLIPLLLGIVYQSLLPIRVNTLFVVLFLIVTYIILFFIAAFKQYNRQWLWGVCISLVLFFTGTSLIQQVKTTGCLPIGKQVTIQALVTNYPTPATSTLKVQAKAIGYSNNGEWQKCSEKLILYFPISDSTLKPGNLLLVNTQLQTIAPPQNPEEFDYQKYMARQGIFTAGYVKGNHYQITEQEAGDFLKQTIWHLQDYILATLQKAGINTREQGVLATLILGNKQWLDKNLRQAYTNAGVAHTLAVSGMHVSILAMLLNVLLAGLAKKSLKGRIFKTLLLLIFIWTYALLANLSPSIIRACTMLTFVSLGGLAKREISTYNSLAAAAFFTCLFNPTAVFDVGFQLSYSAVFSIVYLQPKLYKLVKVNFKPLRWLWASVTVSFAAQLGTLPFILYYFHQFPTYFLLANCVVIPAITVIMWLILLLVLLGWCTPILYLLGSILNFLTYWLNEFITFIQLLPHAIIDSIFINRWQAICLAALILLIGIYLKKFRLRVLSAITALLIVFFAIHNIRWLQQNEQQEWTVFNIRNTSFSCIITGHTAICFTDSTSLNKNVDYNTRNYFIKKGIQNKEVVALSSLRNNGYYELKNKLIAVKPPRHIPKQWDGAPLLVDFLLVSSETGLKPEETLKLYHPKLVILDSSLPQWKIREWENVLGNKQINYYNVRDKGAFIF